MSQESRGWNQWQSYTPVTLYESGENLGQDLFQYGIVGHQPVQTHNPPDLTSRISQLPVLALAGGDDREDSLVHFLGTDLYHRALEDTSPVTTVKPSMVMSNESQDWKF